MDRIYEVAHEDVGTPIVSAEKVDGFFVDPFLPRPQRVTLIGTDWGEHRLPYQIHDGELRVTDFRGEVLGSYYIGQIHIYEQTRRDAEGRSDLRVSFLDYSVPFPDAGRIWRRFASPRPLERGEWLSWPEKSWASWLHVVQSVWFGGGREATRYSGSDQYEIEGENVRSIDSFYCELGESINGPGGYFGSNLDALADCLGPGRPGERQFLLVWKHFELSQTLLGQQDMDAVLAVLRSHGVDVATE